MYCKWPKLYFPLLSINKNKTELQINLIANATRELFIFLKQNLIFSVVMVPPFFNV